MDQNPEHKKPAPREHLAWAVKFLFTLTAIGLVLYFIEQNVSPLGKPSKFLRAIYPYLYFAKFGFLTGLLIWLGLDYLSPLMQDLFGKHYITVVINNTIVMAYALLFAFLLSGIMAKRYDLHGRMTGVTDIAGYVMGRFVFIILYYFLVHPSQR
jgi:hypothetical protein